jgi:hypothetical protein
MTWIADHALLGDLHTAALVSRDGSASAGVARCPVGGVGGHPATQIRSRDAVPFSSGTAPIPARRHRELPHSRQPPLALGASG